MGEDRQGEALVPDHAPAPVLIRRIALVREARGERSSANLRSSHDVRAEIADDITK